MMKILENATIFYNDGIKEKFDAVRKTEKGAVIIRILDVDGKKEFIECGYISNDNIKRITGNKKEI